MSLNGTEWNASCGLTLEGRPEGREPFSGVRPWTKTCVRKIVGGPECGSRRHPDRPPARHDPGGRASRSEPEAQAKKESGSGGVLGGAIGGG